jgi:hypothetical protein
VEAIEFHSRMTIKGRKSRQSRRKREVSVAGTNSKRKSRSRFM